MTALRLVGRARPHVWTAAELHALTAERVAAHQARKTAAPEPRPLARTERGRRWGLGACALAMLVLLLDTHGQFGWVGILAALVALGVAIFFAWALGEVAESKEWRG